MTALASDQQQQYLWQEAWRGYLYRGLEGQKKSHLMPPTPTLGYYPRVCVLPFIAEGQKSQHIGLPIYSEG